MALNQNPPEPKTNNCLHCGIECNGTYCSDSCKNYDVE